MGIYCVGLADFRCILFPRIHFLNNRFSLTKNRFVVAQFIAPLSESRIIADGADDADYVCR